MTTGTAMAVENAPNEPQATRDLGPGGKASIWPFFALTYLGVLANLSSSLWQARVDDWPAGVFLAGAFLAYGFIYLLPALAMTGLARLVLRRRLGGRLFEAHSRWPGRILATTAVLCTTLTQLVLLADAFTFRLFGFHLDGFVWNLIVTPGGLESMGVDGWTRVCFGLMVAGLLLAQAAIWLATTRWRWGAALLSRVLGGRVRKALVAGALVAALIQSGAYGVSTIRGYAPIPVASGALPFYVPITMRKLGHAMGWSLPREQTVHLRADKLALRYPLRPLERRMDAKNYNIVWLVGESLRADMLDPEIMPRTWQFARDSHVFARHYSGGNGTRHAMFAMFYGLHGPYWFSFLPVRRGPVLMDLLAGNGYEMELFTSAKFSYPEFDQTLFAKVPSQRLHQNDQGLVGWKCDRQWTDELIRFIDRRDPNRPFMAFLFYESPHASYHFPPECTIRAPYSQSVNYATMDLAKDAPLVKNRYINCCNHLDTQWGKIIDELSRRRLLESTIVALTGDHGEEFMEHGRLGHNSSFTEQQLRVPLILHVPGGTRGRHEGMTSHLDIPPTILNLLGVSNPPSDYSNGQDLLSPAFGRDYCVASDWRRVAILDAGFKAILPVKGARAMSEYTTPQDQPLQGPPSAELLRQRLFQTLKEMSQFAR